MKRIWASLSALLIAANVPAAVSVSIESIAQREGTKLVDIRFDADNSSGASVFVSVSVMDGTNSVASPTLYGDVGGIAAGYNRHIVWDGGSDLNGVLASNLAVTLYVSEPVPSGMALIPAGEIEVDDPDFSGYSVSSPDLFMDTFEVDNALWQSVYVWAVANQYQFQNPGTWKSDGHPVVEVNWWDCIVWCNARSAMEGLSPCYRNKVSNQVIKQWFSGVSASCDEAENGYRLPWAEEWEYAARAGVPDFRYPWGNTIARTNLNCKLSGNHHPDYHTGFRPYTAPVGEFEANAFGLHDMAGNVWEICWDAVGDYRRRKGGSWDDGADEARCGHADTIHETGYMDSTGFRSVRAAWADEATETIVFDSRNYALEVISAHGAPVPAVGLATYAWKSAVDCSVDAFVNEGGTNFTCIGWTGTGSVPASGSSNQTAVVLTDLVSSIVWNWASDDTDNDGMDDDWELQFFSGLHQAATNDFDFDGQDNGSEYIAGTNPTNPASLFKLTTGISPAGFVLEWPTASNRLYNIHWTPDLRHTPFGAFETDIAYPRHSATSSADRGFFKVDVRKR
ncbi:formylglycine-generating enzyme family protein [Pontiella sp.]|uniref:formylglycine-generating enzyme family protein n=1 Tax=Pontiella sp. TaxID=2837462 RepID=UPI003562256A